MSRAARLLPVFLLCALAPAACSPAGALCSKKQQCAPDVNDEIDDESVRVCEVSFDARIRSLRENSEVPCQALADAELAFAGCLAALDCDDFLQPDTNGLCDSEQKALADARDEAEGECASTD